MIQESIAVIEEQLAALPAVVESERPAFAEKEPSG